MKKLFSSGEKPFNDLIILRLAGEVGPVFNLQATKILGDSEDESYAEIFSVSD